jgi:hypothetical protein
MKEKTEFCFPEKRDQIKATKNKVLTFKNE